MITLYHDGTVEFAYFRPGARDVRLAGDFNQWQPSPEPMSCDEQGWWRARLELAPGKHRFKYVIDGRIWETDYAAYGVENDKLGGWNSIVLVAEPIVEVAAPGPIRKAA